MEFTVLLHISNSDLSIITFGFIISNLQVNHFFFYIYALNNYNFFLFIRLSRIAFKQLEPSFLGLFLDVISSILLCSMTVIAAIMITLGFIVWCSDMTQRFPSCETAAGLNITKSDIKIDTSGFYIEMGTAQFGAWGSFAIWVGLSVFALLKLINNHQLRNMKVSMYLERQKLVNEDAFLESPGVSDDGTNSTAAVSE